jgi:hypothetical protein
LHCGGVEVASHFPNEFLISEIAIQSYSPFASTVTRIVPIVVKLGSRRPLEVNCNKVALLFQAAG